MTGARPQAALPGDAEGGAEAHTEPGAEADKGAPARTPSAAPSGTPSAAPSGTPTAASPSSGGPADPAPKPAYPPAASTPTQAAPRGIRYDFNMGARILLPTRSDGGKWRIRLSDLDTGNTLFESVNDGAFVASAKRYHVRFRIEVWDGEVWDGGVWDGDAAVLDTSYDSRDREVLIQFPVGTLGDTLAWFPYALRFQQVHGCALTCAMSPLIIPLLRDQYRHIRFVTHEEVVEQGLAEAFYATYSLGLFFDDKEFVWQPTDFRHVGLHKTAAYILGVSPEEERPALTVSAPGRPIEEPYVCIAVQSSSGCKMWNNPLGWHEVVAHLKASGYRVICIDQKTVHGSGLLFTHIPHGAEDQTGDRPLTERARWLTHAEAFVGLSSGLAWLAWYCGVPTVMVSGFTHPTNEFETPFRVINWHACNSCWNDPAHRFDHNDFMWCPRHQNTPRHFECTRLITGAHVNAVLDKALASRGATSGSGAAAATPQASLRMVKP